MKVIFLDIDGVLNTIYTKERINGMIFVEDKYIKILKEICDKTGAKVVLSSSWRSGWYDIDNGNNNTRDAKDFIALRDKLLEFGIELFDKTPDISAMKRGEEIKQWLEEHKDLNITNFVIFDDMAIVKPFNRYFIQTSFAEGMKEKYIKKAIKMLG